MRSYGEAENVLTCAGNIEDGHAKSMLEAKGLSHVIPVSN
jgi:hypothetical protein